MYCVTSQDRLLDDIHVWIFVNRSKNALNKIIIFIFNLYKIRNTWFDFMYIYHQVIWYRKDILINNLSHEVSMNIEVKHVTRSYSCTCFGVLSITQDIEFCDYELIDQQVCLIFNSIFLGPLSRVMIFCICNRPCVEVDP